jgi:hypothetical protein
VKLSLHNHQPSSKLAFPTSLLGDPAQNLAMEAPAAVTAAAPTDEQIFAQLATLQSLHSKIFQLRSLLPERLIDPVKAAVEASRSGYEPPAALAAHLRSVAVDGDKDVKEFKETWRSEEMREVWKASKESSFPQGSDVWSVDYRNLANSNQVQAGKDAKAESDEDIENVLETFKTENPKIKLERESSVAGRLVADVKVAGQEFTLTQSEGAEEVDAGEWLVTAKTGSQTTARLKEMLQSLQDRPEKRSLKFLLVSADLDDALRNCTPGM